jgi:hypothetical protein
MKYLMLVCAEGPYEAEPDEETTEPGDESGEEIPWVTEMNSRGIRLLGNAVRPPTDATTVRVRDGEVLTTDGPYVETKEWMAGFDVIECANLDEAIEVAAKHPVAEFGMIEVRPLWNDSLK